MPREVVGIYLAGSPVYEAGARFLSYIALPDPADSTQRGKLCVALARWAICEHAKFNPDWRPKIRPAMFMQSDYVYNRTISKGLKILLVRSAYAGAKILTYLYHQPVDERRIRAGTDLESHLLERLKYSTGSRKTLQSRIGRSTKPVAHAAAAIFDFHLVCGDLLRKRKADKNYNWLLFLFFEPVLLARVIELAEQFRVRMPQLQHFCTREEDTIKFVFG
jgi:hypothetical protein